jgi:hypothetical protein
LADFAANRVSLRHPARMGASSGQRQIKVFKMEHVIEE